MDGTHFQQFINAPLRQVKQGEQHVRLLLTDRQAASYALCAGSQHPDARGWCRLVWPFCNTEARRNLHTLVMLPAAKLNKVWPCSCAQQVGAHRTDVAERVAIHIDGLLCAQDSLHP